VSWTIRPGDPEPLGLTLTGEGGNIAVVSADAQAIDLVLFDEAGEGPIASLRLPTRLGDVWSGFVQNLREGQRYALRAYGAFDPAHGLRFDPQKLLVDPYALTLDRPFHLGGETPRAIATAPEPVYAPRKLRPWGEVTIYEMNLRGFTARLEAVPEADRGTFRGLAHPAAIAHLVSLGIAAVELMPCAAWIDERHLPPLGLENVWGYNPVALMAPDPRLAPAGWVDVAAATQALASAGIETILDVVLNHTGESDELGPTLSLRGLDNRTYYRLREDAPALYVNDAGCGNVLALDRPAPMRLALDALRAWAIYGSVSGFRFDLATTLARRENGFDPAAPFLSALRQDPILRGLRLIAEPWDLGPGGYRLGQFPSGWGEWNDRYRDTARRFWRGESGLVGEMATRLSGSQDWFSRKSPARSINFVTAHDGFTLADLVAYARKRNEANGENGRDGSDDDKSWTNGADGETDDPAILAARRRDQRALLATLIFSRGAPMLSMGAELGHSQRGNNNAYAQRAMVEIDWGGADRELTAFASQCLAMRRAHPALRADAFLTGAPPPGGQAPDVVWLRPDGERMRDDDWAAARALIAVLAACDETGEDRVVLALNPTREPIAFAPPPPRPGFVWRRALVSSGEADAGSACRLLPARAVLLLTQTPDEAGRARQGVEDGLLDQLAKAVGVASEWHEIDGARHVVSPQTKRAILAAMRLDATNAAAIRDAMRALADERDRRALPYWTTAAPEAPVRLRLPGGPPERVLATASDGSIRALRPRALEATRWRAVDGSDVDGVIVALPPQPEGETILRLEGRQESCALLVAGSGFRPAGDPALSGLGAQLYSLRRDGDQGVGDFTTLAEALEGSARAGLQALGVNPLHALFPRDPERASPYSPSDRRRLDPIYLDVEALAVRFGVSLPPAPSNAGAFVDYPAVRAYKRAAMERVFTAARQAWAQDATLAQSVRRFRQEGGRALERFAVFEALSPIYGANWRLWSPPLAQGRPDALDRARAQHADAIDLCVFEQWACETQLAQAAERGRAAGLTLGLYRDLAVGAAPDGAEAWADQERLLHGLSIGAPPDPFSAQGQVWSLPPPDPLAIGREAGVGFARLLADNMRAAGALRVDHAMGLQRLFVTPEGAGGADGAYLEMPADLLFARLALESVKARCLVVGEDLGTVPEGFSRRLERSGALSYRVMWFEREGLGFKPPHAYPRAAAACASTHDLPTLAGWWDGADLEERAALGLISASEAKAARHLRQQEKRALLDALVAAGVLDAPLDVDAAFDPRLTQAAHAFVARTPSRLALGQIDDVAAERVAVNLPGTDRERPNWRRRLSADLTALLASPAVAALRRA
jgi:glycogen operon protein